MPGLHKGQPSEAYKSGKMDRFNLRDQPLERRKEISRMGVEARKKNMKRRKEMREQLEMLLSLDVTSKEGKAYLKELGINADDMDNQMLLLTSLFRKAVEGDVQAVKQITEMINDLPDGREEAKVPVINIYGVSDVEKAEK